MINVGKKTVKPAAVYIIRIARAFRKLMMNVMRDDVDFFGDHFDDEVSDDEARECAAKPIGAMGGISVKIKRPMRSKHDHAVGQTDEEQFPAKKEREKNEKWNAQRTGCKPAEKGEPVFSRF